MKRPLVFIQRMDRLPQRVELVLHLDGRVYRHWYDEDEGLTPAQQAHLMTRHLHTFASEMQDHFAATL